MMRVWLCVGMLGHLAAFVFADDAPWVVYPGKDGPGKGKQIVLVCGDEEYRSEEMMPQLGKILAQHHGFRCTVLFPIDKRDGSINPNQTDNIPGLEKLRDADLLVLFLRWRNLPDEQMKPLVEYIESGRPIIGLRTATHAFRLPRTSTYARYSWDWNGPDYEGGFGRQVLGETWISHHGRHGVQSTRGILNPDQKQHPILRGLSDGDIWGPTDVYGVRLPLPGDATPLVFGQVVDGMRPGDPPAAGKVNDPMMPIAWTRTYRTASGRAARVFCCTCASSQDFESEGLRRLLVNACYWALGMEEFIPPRSKVDLVGTYKASPFRFGGFVKGVKPADHALTE